MRISKFIFLRLVSVLLLLLLAPGIFAETPDEKLVSSVKRSDVGSIAQALKDGANPNLTDAGGTTILMIACTFGQKETVKLLLEKGADVNIQSENGNTALMIASRNNRMEIIKLLLAKNPDISLKDKTGNNALNIALSKRAFDAAKLLLKSGQPAELSRSTLQMASRSKDAELFQLLKSKSADEKLSQEIDKRIDEIEKRNSKLATTGETIFFISLFLLAAVFPAFFIWRKKNSAPAKKKFFLHLGATIGSFAALTVIAYAAICILWNIQLTMALSALEKSGKPFKLEQMLPVPVPDAENAAVDLKEAFMLISEPGKPYNPANYKGMIDKKLQGIVIQFSRSFNNDKPPKQFLKSLSSPGIKNTLSSSNADNAFAMLEKAAQKTGYNFNLKYDRAPYVPTPHLYYLNNALLLWTVKAVCEAADGNNEAAYKILFNALKISELQEKDPSFSSYFTEMGNIVTITHILSILSTEYGISPQYAQKFLKELQSIDFDKCLQNACLSEKLANMNTFDALINNKQIDERLKRFIDSRKNPSWISARFPLDKKDFAVYLGTWAKIESLYNVPFWEKSERIKDIIASTPETYPLSKLFTRYMTDIFSRNAYFMDKITLCELTLALQIYKDRKSTYPDSLDDLKPDILGEIPMDYINGKPFTYKKENNGFTLTSEEMEKVQKNAGKNRRR